MTTFGYVRVSKPEAIGEESVQVANIQKVAAELAQPLARIFTEWSGFDPKRTPILDRPVGREMLAAVRSGDTVLVSRLDRLGHSGTDVRATMKALCDRGVRIYAVRGLHNESLDLPPNVAKVVLSVQGIMSDVETALRSEASLERAQWRRERGLACGYPGLCRKIVRQHGVKRIVWDEGELRHVMEAVERLAKGESPEAILIDFWKRGIKDPHGQPWGKPTTRDGHPPNGGFTCRLYRMVRWFQNAKHEGTLPPPFDAIAWTIPECKLVHRRGFSRGT